MVPENLHSQDLKEHKYCSTHLLCVPDIKSKEKTQMQTEYNMDVSSTYASYAH